MVDVQIKELIFLSLEKIKKYLPSNSKITRLANAGIGKQERDAVVIGEFCEIQRRTLLTGKQPPIRLLLKEVLPDNSLGLHFYVLIYGKTINLVEEALKSKGKSPLWIGFSNLSVVKYTGQQEVWCPYDLRIDEDEEENDDKKLILFYHRNKHKELPVQYESLNNIKHKKRINVFVAVQSIIKQAVVLNNKSTHLMLSLIDPSCLEKNAQYKDIPLHIFLNQQLDNFPTSFAVGDILRIRDILGDFYEKDKKMFGMIYNSRVVVKFRLREDGDKVTPISSNSSYVLTAQDEDIVRELRQWWINHMEEEEKQISQITSPCTFNLNCLIKDVRVIEVKNVVILRVTDRTKSKVRITTVNFKDDDVELPTKDEKLANARLDSDEIYITVFETLLKKVANLKPGDIVQLRNVTCENLADGEESSYPLTLDFFMKNDNCEVSLILEHSSTVGQLIRSLIGCPEGKSCVPLHSDINESEKKYRGESKTSPPPLLQTGDKVVVKQSPTSPSSSCQVVNGKDNGRKRKVGHYLKSGLNSKKVVCPNNLEHK